MIKIYTLKSYECLDKFSEWLCLSNDIDVIYYCDYSQDKPLVEVAGSEENHMLIGQYLRDLSLCEVLI